MTGPERCMIYRTQPRLLTDGCDTCRMSATYCQAVRDMERRPCCDRCTH